MDRVGLDAVNRLQLRIHAQRVLGLIHRHPRVCHCISDLICWCPQNIPTHELDLAFGVPPFKNLRVRRGGHPRSFQRRLNPGHLVLQRELVCGVTVLGWYPVEVAEPGRVTVQ